MSASEWISVGLVVIAAGIGLSCWVAYVVLRWRGVQNPKSGGG
jgi:hypothetical protein